ncbi:MAG: hypothetical protein KGI38_05905 [Thaumarchaeota archaeon]|nr:hypothetical protein [Nitrososphaerota archaeon]
MPDFDDAPTEVCKSVLLEVLGGRGRNSTSWWPAKSGVSMADCARNPQDFDDALVDLFQPMGALVIEAKILSRLYRRHGAKYKETDNLCFVEEVNRARLLLEKKESLR